MTIDASISELIVSIFQAISSGLIFICLWFAKDMWKRLNQIETEAQEHKLQVQREISELKFETLTRIFALENKGNEE